MILMDIWHVVANMVFVESPTSVGYSYSNTSSDNSFFSDKLTGKKYIQNSIFNK